MASKSSSESLILIDGSMDFSGGVDSSKVKTLQSSLNPNGLARNQLAWMTNASVRDGGVIQRTGWQPLLRLLASGYWQGGFMYEPDGANPYLVCSISGVIYKVLLESPYSITDLSAAFSLYNPADPAIAEMAFFAQGENILVIQAGDYFTQPNLITTNSYSQALVSPSSTLPLFWDGTTLRRSRGITTVAPTNAPNINEIPAATCMDYYGGRLWYAKARAISAGDIVGGPSGNVANHYRDSIISVTENPLCFAGDGFTVPTNAGNIRAIKHSANINVSLGEGQLYIFTRKTVYSLDVPTTRTDWTYANNQNQPKMTVVQLVNGAVGSRCVVPVNGDLYYQSFDPAVRSLKRAVQYFEQPGNTAISQNELRALQLNDRSLMRFSSGIEFDQRMLQLVLPQLAADGVNIIHTAILPLDFDNVTNLQEKADPVWEGVYDGLQMLELFSGDFGGLPRAFAAVISETDGGIDIWELTTSSRFENGDNRVIWSVEFPAFTWSSSGEELQLKQLNGGEMWIDKVAGTVEFAVYFREDADPCWRKWFATQVCAARCNDLLNEPVTTTYPCEPTREGYRYPVVLPEPPNRQCDSMGIRPTTIGYQFQVLVMVKGWCRIRALMLHALPKMKQQFQGLTCTTTAIPMGMRSLPNPFT